jgi:hypothetical protein
MTFLELQTELQRRLEETSTGVFWALAQQKEALNDAYFEMADATEFAETSESVDLTTDTYYDLSSVLDNVPLTVHGVFSPQLNHWLTPTTVRELDDRWARWVDQAGEPQEFFIRGLWWLGTYPKLSSAAGTMTVHYTYVPAALSADGDTPGFPQEFHVGLLDYAMYDLLCQEREGKKALKFYDSYLGYQERLKQFVQGRAAHDRVTGLR